MELEGREFSRKIDYDVRSGQFNVQLNVAVKLIVDEDVQNQTSIVMTHDNYMQAAQQQYSQTVGGTYDPSRNIQYSGNLTYDNDATITLNMGVEIKRPGDRIIAGISGPGFASAHIATNNIGTGTFSMKDAQSFGVIATHELLHQGGLLHPTELGNPSDAQLNHSGDLNYTSTPSTTSKIAYNVMLYGFYNVDGQNVNSVRGGNNNGTQATPGQMNVINSNISEGKVNGEPMK